MSKKIPKGTLTDTGERMIPEFHRGTFMYGEHYVRYQSVTPIVHNKIVLDIACGSGYGTKKIAESAKKVYGVDIDAETIRYAKKHFPTENAEFLLGDGINIPLEDNSVDVVVSFETIEHIVEYNKFLKECLRVLKDDGVMVLSTPNDIEFSEDNHFHVHEFVYKELESLVNKYFKYSKTYFQGTWVANGIFDKDELTSEWSSTQKLLNLSPKATDRAIYFMVVASNKKLSLDVEKTTALSDHWSRREIEEEHKATFVHVRNLDSTIAKSKTETDTLKAEIVILKGQLNQIKSSRSWKVAKKLQSVKHAPKKLFGK